MKKIKVIIVDDIAEVREVLYELISVQEDMEVVGIAENGEEAVQLIIETKPDIILLDIAMPHMDGLEVLKKINDIKPKIMIISAMGQDKIIQEALELGADYFIVKPIDYLNAIDRIRKLTGKKNTIRTDKNEIVNIIMGTKIDNLFNEIGISKNLKGHEYFKEAVIISIENGKLDIDASNIYRKISRKLKTKESRIKRDMRYAIESTWNKNEEENMRKFFNYKPTVKEFIETVVSIIIKLK